MSIVAAVLLGAAIACRGNRSRWRVRARTVVRVRTLRGRGWTMRASSVAGIGLALLSPRLAAVSVVIALAVSWRRLRRRTERVHDDVALTLDVMAACIEAGATTAVAARAVAATAAGAMAAALLDVATALERGADPVVAWCDVTAVAPALAPAARACSRTALTGAAVADELRRSAVTSREQRVAEQKRRVQRASVWMVLPLGLCFLPAFVLVGVVPVVVGMLPGFGR